MELELTQILVFLGLTALIAIVTYFYCRGQRTGETGEREYFLAGGSLKWYFVAGSITLTNLSTDQLVGMNGNQMALVAWWELAAVVGLIMLCFIFIPVYYKYNCTTTTELLEKRYKDPHIRALISLLFLAGNIFIFLPAIMYGGSLVFAQMFELENLDILGSQSWGIKNANLYIIAVLIAIAGSAYAIFGGLRAVAISDTFSGILLLSIALYVVWLSLKAINFDFSGIPPERLSLIGNDDSPIPFTTLFTGMLFIQMFYWSTNQTITQRAMASPSVKEAQKGILAAAGIRLLIVPPIIVIPGIVSYKFKEYGIIEDNMAYGTIVTELLPTFLNGAFAAAIIAAVLTSINSILNASAALWVCDIHETYINKKPNVKRLSIWVSIILVLLAFVAFPVYANSSDLIGKVQNYYGYLSMPILSAFIVGLLFKNVEAKSVLIAVPAGVVLYAYFNLGWPTFKEGSGLYIHYMAITLLFTVTLALLLNRFVYKKRAIWDAHNVFGKAPAEL